MSLLARWSFWDVARLTLAFAAAIAGVYYLLVAFGNVTNPDVNWDFVEGVTEMDSVPDVGYSWRSVSPDWIQAVFYAGIILGEMVAGVMLFLGGVGGLARVHDHPAWVRAQRLTLGGSIAVLLVFWLGFIDIGGEWWIMWLNDSWNGLTPAFQNTTLVLLVVIGIIAVAAAGDLRERVLRPFEEAVEPSDVDAP